jgi:hypothetical protein
MMLSWRRIVVTLGLLALPPTHILALLDLVAVSKRLDTKLLIGAATVLLDFIDRFSQSENLSSRYESCGISCKGE